MSIMISSTVIWMIVDSITIDSDSTYFGRRVYHHVLAWIQRLHDERPPLLEEVLR